MSLRAVAADLYSLPPQEFIAARNGQAAAAKQAGDDPLAASIKALRRPSNSAALVNGLVRERAQQIEELLAVGGRLRAAQEAGAGDDLRALMRTRQELMATLLRDAEQRSAELDVRFTTAIQREVQATLIAAVADPDAGQALRSGTLVSGLNYAGFGDASEPAASPGSGDDGDDEDELLAWRRRKAQERLAAAKQEAAERGEQLRAAESDVAELDDQLAEKARELQRLQERRDLAGSRLAAAQAAHAAAIHEVDQAAQSVP